MSLLVKASREGQTIARVTPETALWKHVGFAAYRLETGDVVQVHEAQREVCIVVLSGTVSISGRSSALATACSRTLRPTRFIYRPSSPRLYEQIAMRKSVWRVRPLRASTHLD